MFFSPFHSASPLHLLIYIRLMFVFRSCRTFHTVFVYLDLFFGWIGDIAENGNLFVHQSNTAIRCAPSASIKILSVIFKLVFLFCLLFRLFFSAFGFARQTNSISLVRKWQKWYVVCRKMVWETVEQVTSHIISIC